MRGLFRIEGWGRTSFPNQTKSHPILYVLDGQQRLTSLFVTFQTDFQPPSERDWRAVYFDLKGDDDRQQSRFQALVESEVEPDRHFPLSSLFDPVKYRISANKFTDPDEIIAIDRLHNVFKEAKIPVETMETDDRGTVAVVFERINRQGVTLSTLELLSAWTWSEDFDLRRELEGLQEDLADFGMADLVAEPDLLLRCAAAILKDSPAMSDLVELNGDDIRSRFDEVKNGLKGAVEFLGSQLHVHTAKTLPYQLILVPLSVFFAVRGDALLTPTAAQIATLKQWFWRACFFERYSGQTVRAAKSDIQEMRKLRANEEHGLGSFAADYTVKPDFFLSNNFRINNSRTATFVNLLAQRQPRSLISGNLVDLRRVLQSYNKAEFHHIYPKAFLERSGGGEGRSDCLANFCFLSRADNNTIRAKAPSHYVAQLPTNPDLRCKVLTSAAINEDLLIADEFNDFLVQRAATLSAYANELMGTLGGGTGAPATLSGDALAHPAP